MFKLVIIGSGPGGYIAAARAGSLGIKTAIIEKDHMLGGTCLHQGCIPTKFLLHAMEKYNDIQKIKKIGIYCNNIDINWDKLQIYKNNILKKNALGINSIMNSNHIEMYNGRATINSIYNEYNTITIKNRNNSITISTENILFAIGSQAKKIFSNIIISGNRIMNSDDILNIKEIPQSLVIIGGGVIGCEFASIFSGFHTSVTILESSR